MRRRSRVRSPSPAPDESFRLATFGYGLGATGPNGLPASSALELNLEVQMDRPLDRRKFLKVSGMSLGVGALISFAPALAASGSPAARVRNWFRRQNGEEVSPFNLVQLSDAHVGFQGPPNPTGTKAFERAIDVINGLNPQPDLILFTGDLTHEAEVPGEHAKRMQLFQTLTSRL